MIIRLDDMPIRSHEDLQNHIGQTKVDFIEIRAGRLETGVVQLSAPVPK